MQVNSGLVEADTRKLQVNTRELRGDAHELKADTHILTSDQIHKNHKDKTIEIAPDFTVGLLKPKTNTK